MVNKSTTPFEDVESSSILEYPRGRGGGTKTKVGGLTLPLNDCTEAGVQGLHSEEFFSPLASEKVVGLSPPPPHSSEGGGGG